jgi:hypothetical protein
MCFLWAPQESENWITSPPGRRVHRTRRIKRCAGSRSWEASKSTPIPPISRLVASIRTSTSAKRGTTAHASSISAGWPRVAAQPHSGTHSMRYTLLLPQPSPAARCSRLPRSGPLAHSDEHPPRAVAPSPANTVAAIRSSTAVTCYQETAPRTRLTEPPTTVASVVAWCARIKGAAMEKGQKKSKRGEEGGCRVREYVYQVGERRGRR